MHYLIYIVSIYTKSNVNSTFIRTRLMYNIIYMSMMVEVDVFINLEANICLENLDVGHTYNNITYHEPIKYNNILNRVIWIMWTTKNPTINAICSYMLVLNSFCYSLIHLISSCCSYCSLLNPGFNLAFMITLQRAFHRYFLFNFCMCNFSKNNWDFQ